MDYEDFLLTNCRGAGRYETATFKQHTTSNYPVSCYIKSESSIQIGVY